MIVTVGGGHLLVITPRRRRVRNWVWGIRWDGVEGDVDPGFSQLQDPVAVVAGVRPGDVTIAADERVVYRHVRERDVSDVGEGERVCDRLADGRGRGPLLRHINPGGEVEAHGVIVTVGGGHLLVITPRRRRVRNWVWGIRWDGVEGDVDPGFSQLQDPVAVVAGVRPGDVTIAADERVVYRHVRERDVSDVGEGERVCDRLADGRGRGPLLRHIDPGGDVERQGKVVVILGPDLLVVTPGRRHVRHRVGSTRWDGVGGRIDPGLIKVEDAIPIVTAVRPGDITGPTENCVLHRHIREGYVARVPDREGVGDLLPDGRGRGPGLGELNPGGKVERYGEVISVDGLVLVVTRRCHRVDQGVGGAGGDRVGRRVVPFLPEFQDAVAVVTGVRPGDIAIAAEERVVHLHVCEGDVACVCEGKGVGDLLADMG